MAEKKIGDRTYRADKLDALNGFELFLRIGKLVGPSLGDFLAAFKGRDDEAMLKALGSLMVGADVAETKALLVALVEKAEAKVPGGGYEKVVWGHHVGDDLATAMMVAAFVMGVNFRDFLSVAGRLGLIPAGALDGFSPEAT